jgi:hypothetical protein
MKDLRYLLGLIILMIVFLQSCNISKRNTDHDFSLKINEIAKVSDDTLKDWYCKARFYKIDLSLVNNTDSTVHFWMFTCSWNTNFITNYQDIQIVGPFKCIKNFPKVYDLDKNQKINFKGLIAIKDSFDLNKKIKLGFIYIRSYEHNRLVEIVTPPPGDSIELKKHNTHNNIIWSEYFNAK